MTDAGSEAGVGFKSNITEVRKWETAFIPQEK